MYGFSILFVYFFRFISFLETYFYSILNYFLKYFLYLFFYNTEMIPWDLKLKIALDWLELVKTQPNQTGAEVGWLEWLKRLVLMALCWICLFPYLFNYLIYMYLC